MPRRSAKTGVRDRMYNRKGRGWYLDLRDVNGKRDALIDRERGESCACQDFDRAYELAKARLELAGDDPELEVYTEHHLNRKAKRRRQSTIDRDEISFGHVTGWLRRRLGREPRLSDVTEDRMLEYIAWREPAVAEQTLLHELHAVSNLFKRATAERKARYNPIPTAKEIEDLSVHRSKPEWLEVGEAGKLLRITAEMDADKNAQRCPYLQAVVATGLLTGARPGELYGMQTADIDFEAGVVRIRHNHWRRLKRPWHERKVPLWPQLRLILETHIERWEPDDLLFPSHLTGKPYTNLNDGLRSAFDRAEIDKRKIRLYILRHTYTATRMQTLDGGAPVNPYTVAEELGHRDLNLIMRTYGHLQEDRQRLPRVEYRETTVTEITKKRTA